MLRTFAVLAVLAGAGPLHGQDTVVAPGSAVLRTSLLREGTVEFTIHSEVNGQERVWGREAYETVFAEQDGTPVIVSTQRFWTADDMEGEPYQTDVYTVERASLSPLSQVFSSMGREGRIAFDGGRIRGTFGDGVTLDAAIERPGFHLDPLDLVLGSLPLRPGFQAVLVAFAPEDGAALRIGVSVRGEETVATEDGGRCRGWRVELDYGEDGPGEPATYWIAPDTRELVAYQPASSTRGVRRTGCSADAGS